MASPSSNNLQGLIPEQPLPLLSFPGELLLMIASNLSASDIGHLVLTNRYLSHLLTPSLYTAGSQLYNFSGETPLHWAAVENQPKVATLLIERGASRQAQTFYHLYTPLHLAVMYGHLEVAKCLFDDSLMELVDSDNKAPVHVAASRGHDDILRFMLDKRLEAVSIMCGVGMTPLHYAADAGHATTASLLLSRGAEMCLSNAGLTPFHCALDSGREDVVRVFLDNDTTGGLVKIFCGVGNPVLTYAFGVNKPAPISLLELLIKHGADVNTRSRANGQNSVFYAASAGGPAALRLFLKHGGRVTDKDHFGVTALHEAAALQPATVGILLEAGAKVNEKDDEGQTPLYWAVERGQEDAVRTLLAGGADINAVDTCGMSSLSRACAQCCVHVNVKMVKLLLENGAHVDSKDTEGMTALHHASREGHAEIAALLLRRGARARDRDISGDSALDLAEAYSKTQVVDLLRQNIGLMKL